MKQLVLVILVFLKSIFTFSQETREEFNGPFESWANIKTRFNAKGDGKTDDTRAIQMALDSLTSTADRFNTGANAYTAIYLPKGRYKITSGLVLRGKIGIQVIGEDPENTILEWHGKQSDTMIWTNGSSYYKISRIKFSGRGISGVRGLGIHWKNKWKSPNSRSFAPLNIEISDCIFTDLLVGLSGGYKWNDSEVKINRCVFNKCSRAGIEIRSPNALDYWIWHCKFYNCGTGVSNYKGNYHLYSSYFKGSISADVNNDDGYYTSIRGCFSEDSYSFSNDHKASSNPFVRVFQDNVVIRSKVLPIKYVHTGKPTLYGNVFDKNVSDTFSDPSATRFLRLDYQKRPNSLAYSSWANPIFSILSVGNSYYYKDPLFYKGRVVKNYIVDDITGIKPTISSEEFIKAMPKTPRYKKRIVFEVPAGANAGIIQDIIDKASALKGQRSIIHFPFGQFFINRTIIIPQGADIQIVGDGLRYSTTIAPPRGGGFIGNALFKVKGPSYVEFRDIQLSSMRQKFITAIEFSGIDQKGSQVHLDQIYSLTDTSIIMDRLNYTLIEKNNSFFSDGNILIGGDLVAKGSGTAALHCFGGSYAGLSVSNNARFVSKDCWWEGANPVPLDLTGSGTITIDGTKMAPIKGDSTPIIKVNNFKGKISLLNMYVQGGIQIGQVQPELKFFLWNTNFYYSKDIQKSFPSKHSGQLGFAGISSQCFIKNDPECKLTKSYPHRFVNAGNEGDFIRTMTAQTREVQPVLFSNLADGISNVNVTRVAIDGFGKGLVFKQ